MPRLNELQVYPRKVGGPRYGIELEMEGPGVPRVEPPTNWDSKRDGSLGPHGVEFVSRQAFNFDRTELMLRRMKQALDDSHTTPDCTVACSSHVHMNVQDLEVVQVLNIATTYYILEDYITRLAGPERQGNLFCLRLSDSEVPLERLRMSIEEGLFPRGINEDVRSSALNLCSLATFGTLEFRAFRGVNDPMELLDWVTILQKIRDFSLGFEDPAAIVQHFSIRGAHMFAAEVLGPDLIETIGPVSEEELYEGVFRVQWLAFDCDLSKLKEVRYAVF